MIEKKFNRFLTISNVLTGSRLVLTPFIVLSLQRQAWTSALWLFFIAGLSDLLDGLAARLFDEPTWLGAILDPIADKVLIVASLGAFLVYSPSPLLPRWFVLVIAVREVILLVGGGVLYIKNNAFRVEPSFYGKATMCLMLLLMMATIVAAAFNIQLEPFLFVLQMATLITGLVSFMEYIFKGFLALR